MTTVRVPAGTMEKMRLHASQSVAAAAKKCHTSEDEVRDWEAGAADPPLSILRDLAALYRIPLSAFLLSNPVLPKPPTTERRVYADGREPKTTPELAAALHRAVAMQEVAREVMQDIAGPRFVPVGDEMPAEQLAIAQREALGVTMRQQLAWDQECHGSRPRLRHASGCRKP